MQFDDFKTLLLSNIKGGKLDKDEAKSFLKKFKEEGLVESLKSELMEKGIELSDENLEINMEDNTKEEVEEKTEDIENIRLKIEASLQEDTEYTNTQDVENKFDLEKLVDTIITKAIGKGASDIHFEPIELELDEDGKRNMEVRVRFRLDGVLQIQEKLNYNIVIHNAVVSHIKNRTKMRIEEKRKPQDGRLKIEYIAGKIRKVIEGRVSILPSINGEKVVIRLLDLSKTPPGLEDMGFSEIDFKRVREALRKTKGLILVTGPTGSGKSTTLQASMRILNVEGVNIQTFEDPVEYRLKGINQTQIHPEIGFDFAAGIRSALRQDPDIISVGEIRDSETAKTAIEASLTGHLVLSTVHVNDTASVVSRMKEQGIEPGKLANSLILASAQRLPRVLCSKCSKFKPLKEIELKQVFDIIKGENSRGLFLKLIGFKGDPNKINDQKLHDFLIQYNSKKGFKSREENGCEHCNYTGYKGRTCVAEVLTVTDEISELILNDESVRVIERKAKEQGMFTLLQNGMLKLFQSKTDFEEVFRVLL